MINKKLTRMHARDHPQSYGLAERMVQTVKEALRKYVLKSERHHSQRTTLLDSNGLSDELAGYSPYFLLFGRWPIIGTTIKKVYSKMVDLDNPQIWERVVEERARLFEKEMPIAFNNLAIAQHRDTLRYAHTRSGYYKPKLKRFEVGDLVYFKRQKFDSMDPRVGRIFLRIIKVD
jgi:hypothetical protein